jgi:hypothetical protein
VAFSSQTATTFLQHSCHTTPKPKSKISAFDFKEMASAPARNVHELPSPTNLCNAEIAKVRNSQGNRFGYTLVAASRRVKRGERLLSCARRTIIWSMVYGTNSNQERSSSLLDCHRRAQAVFSFSEHAHRTVPAAPNSSRYRHHQDCARIRGRSCSLPLELLLCFDLEEISVAQEHKNAALESFKESFTGQCLPTTPIGQPSSTKSIHKPSQFDEL